ncbi:nuclear transport factor 2 family protein [Sphingomonas psychrolutea]|uniref:Bile-acid 7-alpha-dehydratase n=1 Tax=Sphingomonas psychrolutea TaxID=1259676 RepID=A0ABQ1G5B5_9SPHN|nr:nuclear transport factor 2 family protein [Sphingomonas psychrolutea]GGA37174.1 bile-acid 7-alpha-dehydratase [Sphingomonas psychrolutea]
MMPDDIADRIAICELKARYCRLLDTKQWDAWTEVFTENCVLDTSEAGGPPPIHGRDAAVASVRAFIEAARTVHHVHTPEIDIDGDTAQGIWAMQDRVVFDAGHSLTGYGHYTDRYAKSDGTWRIAESKLTRLILDITAPAAT